MYIKGRFFAKYGARLYIPILVVAFSDSSNVNYGQDYASITFLHFLLPRLT